MENGGENRGKRKWERERLSKKHTNNVLEEAALATGRNRSKMNEQRKGLWIEGGEAAKGE